VGRWPLSLSVNDLKLSDAFSMWKNRIEAQGHHGRATPAALAPDAWSPFVPNN
jgi:hypothetical protein